MAQGLWFRTSCRRALAQGSGLGYTVKGLGCRDQGGEFREYDAGCMVLVHGLWSRTLCRRALGSEFRVHH